MIRPAGAEQSIVNLEVRQKGFHPTDVKCPSGVDAKVGGTFDCHFTGPGGQPYTAHMRIQQVQGQRVVFFIQTRPSGQ